jgi:5'-deoxynucleotidase YfbR-like HD superfamily hydrolase
LTNALDHKQTTTQHRLMKLAVVHDLAEALVGDIVPHDTRYTKEQKRAMEEVSAW